MHAHWTGLREPVEVVVQGFCNSLTLEDCLNVRVICDGVIENVSASKSAMVSAVVHNICMCIPNALRCAHVHVWEWSVSRQRPEHALEFVYIGRSSPKNTHTHTHRLHKSQAFSPERYQTPKSIRIMCRVASQGCLYGQRACLWYTALVFFVKYAGPVLVP
jgi:hypothetical protein